MGLPSDLFKWSIFVQFREDMVAISIYINSASFIINDNVHWSHHTILLLIRGDRAPHSVTIFFFSVHLMISQINELRLQLDP